MKGGLESQGGFGGRLQGPWPQEGRVASDTHWPHVRAPDLLGSGRTLCPLLRLSVFLTSFWAQSLGLCVCVCACQRMNTRCPGQSELAAVDAFRMSLQWGHREVPVSQPQSKLWEGQQMSAWREPWKGESRTSCSGPHRVWEGGGPGVEERGSPWGREGTGLRPAER